MKHLIHRAIVGLLRLFDMEIVVVLPPPDRSVYRQFDLFDKQDMYRKRLDREG